MRYPMVAPTLTSPLLAALLLSAVTAQVPCPAPGGEPERQGERLEGGEAASKSAAGFDEFDQSVAFEAGQDASDRPRRWFGRGELAFGWASLDVDAGRLGRDRDEGSAALRFDLQAMPKRWLGGGLTFEVLGSADLFEGQTIDNGAALVPADATFSMIDLDAHVTLAPIANSRFALPIQLGPWIQSGTLDYDDANATYEFATIGLRVGVRPEWTIVRSHRTDITLFGGATFGVGTTLLDEDIVNREETYDSSATQFRAEGGIRCGLGSFTLGLSYAWSDTRIDDSDLENGRSLPDIDFDASMFLLTIGGRF